MVFFHSFFSVGIAFKLVYLGLYHGGQCILDGVGCNGNFCCGMAGIGLSLFGLQFALAPKENTSVYISCNNAMAGVVGFVASLAGSAFIGATNGYSFSIGSFVICDMQLLFIASTVLGALCVWYISRLEKRLKRNALVQKEEKEPALV